jgi:TldD protein
MEEIINAFLNVANKKKVEYADIRVLSRRREEITVRDGKVESLGLSSEDGFGVRVLVGGRWGFAASRDVSATESATIAEQAVRIALASGQAGGKPVSLDDCPPEQGEYVTPCEQDPFGVPLEDKLARLFASDAAMAKAAPVSHRSSF